MGISSHLNSLSSSGTSNVSITIASRRSQVEYVYQWWYVRLVEAMYQKLFNKSVSHEKLLHELQHT